MHVKICFTLWYKTNNETKEQKGMYNMNKLEKKNNMQQNNLKQWQNKRMLNKS